MPVTLTQLPIAQQLAIKALLETGKSERQTAKLSGVSRETVRAVRIKQDLDPQAVDRIKAGLAGKLYSVADRSLEHITDDKLDKANPVQLMTTAAIGIDKARLIEGKATSRTEFVDATDVQIQAEIERLEGELKANAIDTEGYEDEATTPDRLPAPQTVGQVSGGAV